jgi:hypothetical protein
MRRDAEIEERIDELAELLERDQKCVSGSGIGSLARGDVTPSPNAIVRGSAAVRDG